MPVDAQSRFWGSGVDHIYPPQNVTLAQQIIERGAVISDTRWHETGG